MVQVGRQIGGLLYPSLGGRGGGGRFLLEHTWQIAVIRRTCTWALTGCTNTVKVIRPFDLRWPEAQVCACISLVAHARCTISCSMFVASGSQPGPQGPEGVQTLAQGKLPARALLFLAPTHRCTDHTAISPTNDVIRITIHLERA